jgi:hypothetical protein
MAGPRQRKKGRNTSNEDEPDSSAAATAEQRQQAALKGIQKMNKTKKAKKQKKKGSSKKLYIWGTLVGGLTIISSLFYYAANLLGGGNIMWMDAATRDFIKSFVCNDPNGGYCHAGLVPYRRTQKATKLINPGERVLTVPRHLQIWDLDALRDDFVQTELASARHVHSLNPLHSGAFLAAYLARRAYYLNGTTDSDDPMRPYFDILPTYKALEAFHPVLWSERRLASLLEPHTWSYNVARGYQDMVRSEYAAFADASMEFASQISEEQYKTMRVNVLSRSFGSGPPTEADSLPDQSLEEELEMYKERMGVDLTKGCHAMVPILDMYDHHPKPNVGWEYDEKARSFVITAITPIPPGQEIIDSYGKYSDPHLFGKFGFVNGDGSAHTEVSIAALHKPLDIGMREQFSYLPFSGETEEELVKYQKKLMVQYLIFDDGYTDCIEKEADPEGFELKKLKLEHLNRIANNPKRWVMRMPPRTESSLPAKTTDTPITLKPPEFDVQNIDIDASKIIETCRLISLAGYDFDGNAAQVLKEALESDELLVIDSQGPDLEYRALACLSRLSGVARWRFQKELEAEMKLVRELTYEDFQSRKWAAAQVRLGEMQTLEVVHRVAISGLMEMANRIQEEKGGDSIDDIIPIVRDTPCPAELSQALLEETSE